MSTSGVDSYPAVQFWVAKARVRSDYRAGALPLLRAGFRKADGRSRPTLSTFGPSPRLSASSTKPLTPASRHRSDLILEEGGVIRVFASKGQDACRPEARAGASSNAEYRRTEPARRRSARSDSGTPRAVPSPKPCAPSRPEPAHGSRITAYDCTIRYNRSVACGDCAGDPWVSIRAISPRQRP